MTDSYKKTIVLSFGIEKGSIDFQQYKTREGDLDAMVNAGVGTRFFLSLMPTMTSARLTCLTGTTATTQFSSFVHSLGTLQRVLVSSLLLLLSMQTIHL